MKKTALCAGVALLMPVAMAFATNMPDLKEGLWSIQRETVDTPGGKKDTWPLMKICRTHAYDEYVLNLAKKQAGCTITENMQGSTLLQSSHCVVGAMVIETKSTTTVQGDTATHAESHTTFTPAMQGNTGTDMTMDAKYLGACPAGMKPGDKMTSDGKIVPGNWKP